ncbi:MAG: hypothetical protein VXY93_12725, partial [Pseudomonadota bacterium]|nr:hypothetical protein [Pseudomonadota bacterium]
NVGLSGDLDVDGHTNLDNVSVSGVSTFTDNIIADRNIGIGTDNPAAPLHIAGPDAASARILIEDDNNNIAPSEILVQNGGRDLRISAPNDIIFTRVSGGTPLLYLENGQNVGIGTADPSTKLDVFGNTILRNDLDVDGHTNLDNVSIAGVSTFTGNIDANGDLDVDGHTNLDNVSVAGVTTFAENAKAVFGNSGELEIFRSGTESAIVETQGNNLNLAGNRVNLLNQSRTEVLIQAIANGPVELYHNNTKRLETSSVGVSIPQDLDVDGHTNLDNVSIAGVTTFSSNLDLNADIDVDGHTNLDNVSIAGVTTMTGMLRIDSGNLQV